MAVPEPQKITAGSTSISVFRFEYESSFGDGLGEAKHGWLYEAGNRVD